MLWSDQHRLKHCWHILLPLDEIVTYDTFDITPNEGNQAINGLLYTYLERHGYFTDEYGFSYYAAFPGCSAETEPSAATVSFLIEKTKEKNIPVVFKIEFSNGKVAETIADAAGAKVLLMHSCHNIDADSMENGATYVSLMEGNLKNLKEAVS